MSGVFPYLDFGVTLFVLVAGFGFGAVFGWSLAGRIDGDDGEGAQIYDLDAHRTDALRETSEAL